MQQAEIRLLKQFSGDKLENGCLKDINFTSGKHIHNDICTYMYIHVPSIVACIYRVCMCCSEMVFSNGCRAPPWRQVLGDIAYITVNPMDGAQICVTASTEGYYINKVGQLVIYWVLESLHTTL